MATDTMVEEIIESYTLWLSNINEIMDLAGTSIDTFASDTENNLNRINTKTNEVADSIDDLSQEIVDDFDYIIDTVSDWEDNYVDAIDTTI
jgi:methyl-accepting chemotaxis protein